MSDDKLVVTSFEGLLCAREQFQIIADICIKQLQAIDDALNLGALDVGEGNVVTRTANVLSQAKLFQRESLVTAETVNQLNDACAAFTENMKLVFETSRSYLENHVVICNFNQDRLEFYPWSKVTDSRRLRDARPLYEAGSVRASCLHTESPVTTAEELRQKLSVFFQSSYVEPDEAAMLFEAAGA